LSVGLICVSTAVGTLGI